MIRLFSLGLESLKYSLTLEIVKGYTMHYQEFHQKIV
jgi:hypothetical protein